jgi:hypothetical protein
MFLLSVGDEIDDEVAYPRANMTTNLEDLTNL